ncbi:DNA cytosine methyltransferase [Lachnoclostridium pacaense]|uniref:DNA cytosine methyltransferase n=1 Tax=Enterocloster hominis (ex Hitch et al. 2024) TaxID=1917870 RepID=UPI001D12CBFB|nr:DNA cytosine methyltransferase [Lachnoclostridium pacaense]MCC2878299.1 DNA cytosine methyltransferase [Lachnoclostridium pacaense]
MDIRNVRIFSFFSGSGLLDAGFEDCGFTISMVNEFFEPFMEAYIYARQQMQIDNPEFGNVLCDINDFLNQYDRRRELREFLELLHNRQKVIGFIGGPPCPDFSIAGLQRGRDGQNGKLSLSYVNLILEMLPDFFLFENVRGLWSTQRHRAYYEELKTMLQNSGYITTERLVNSLEYGVPQDRERIILIGFKRELLCENWINENNTLNNFDWNNNIRFDADEVKAMQWPTHTPFQVDLNTLCPENIIRELTVENWFGRNDVYNHPNSQDYFRPRAGLARMLVIDEGDTEKKSYKRLHRWRYSPTCAYGNNEVHLHPYKPRRISVSEAMALQSLPREFELPPQMSLTNKFKTIGNGVPYLLAKGVAQTISDYMEMI